MVEELLEGTLTLDGQIYRLVRVPQQGGEEPYAYTREYLAEPPFDVRGGYWQGVPKMLSAPQDSWYYGGFKSRQGIDYTSEYGQNTDTRWPLRLMPGPKLTTITLTDSTDSPICFFEALGYIFVVTARYVYRIDPTTSVVTKSKDFNGLGIPFWGFTGLNGHGYVSVTGAAAALWEVTTIGSPDTWVGVTTVTIAARSCIGINRLFSVDINGLLRNISVGLDPLDTAKYADSVQVGRTDTTPSSIVPYDRSVIVGKPEGVFGVGEEGFGIPLIKRMTFDPVGPHGMINFDPWVLIPHPRGLYRWQPGQVTSAGLEVELLNESVVRGRIWSMVSDGNSVYAFVGQNSTLGYNSDVYMLHGRERKSNEPGFGPFIWDTLVYVPALGDGATFTVYASHVSNLSTTPRLYFGYGKNLRYFKLSAAGGGPDVNGSDYEFATSGNRYTVKYDFNDWGDKDFSKVLLVTKDCDADNYWIVNYSVDGGAFSDLDSSGTQMRANTNGRHSYTLPTTAVGRQIQYRFDFVYDGSGVVPEILYFEPFATPRPRFMSVVTAHLVLDQPIMGMGTYQELSPGEQYDALVALMARSSSFQSLGPWNDAPVDSFMLSVKVLQDIPSLLIQDQIIVEIQFKERVTAS